MLLLHLNYRLKSIDRNSIMLYIFILLNRIICIISSSIEVPQQSSLENWERMRHYLNKITQVIQNYINIL